MKLVNPIHTPAGKGFQRVFRVGIMKFWDLMTGFDVIKFDEWIATPDGTSCEDWTREKHGEEGVSIIRALMNTKPFEEGT